MQSIWITIHLQNLVLKNRFLKINNRIQIEQKFLREWRNRLTRIIDINMFGIRMPLKSRIDRHTREFFTHIVDLLFSVLR